jgi:uncharacterized protein YndB with AHSA1/START domain
MHVELSIVIPAPVEKVWAVAQDPARRPLWDQRVAAYEWLGTVGAGSEIRMVVRMGLLRPEARGKMLRWNPPRQSAVQIFEASSPLVPVGAGSWTFDALPDGSTRWTTRFTLQVERLPWWVSRWAFRQAVYWDTWRSLRRLRRMVMAEG